MKRVTLLSVVLWVLGASLSLASGMLIPKDTSLPPLAIKHQRVDIGIKDGVATAKIEQVFRNHTDRDLEAVYIFPLPENASIADFALYINGKRMSGELVEKGKARKIYQDIVRRMRDPGLLEHMGGNLFRVSVYPVPKQGDQKIELVYSQTLDYDAGLYKYVYPLKTGKQASRTLDDFTVSVRLASSVPIKSVYSPSHKVGISRKGDHEAVIGFEEERSLLDRDFVLYYGVSKKDFGLNLLTHAAKGEDGFFMMMLAPTVVPPDGVIGKKDVTLVLDCSGSMSGKKIAQARNALKYCVEKLNDGDRFNIIPFSTEVEPWRRELVEVDDATRKEALAFVGEIEARGGTAIDGALSMALSMDYEKGRPNIVVFLTDGRPTIGISDSDEILANVDEANKRAARVFVFGVGDDVNTLLLDKVAGQNGGFPQYVKPDEDIEVKLSSFADKISYPVLGRPRIEVDKLKVMRVHPAELPDLFRGEQLTVFGRYEGDGHVAIRLMGEVDGKAREFVYEGRFPAANVDNGFIPRLWATRRVGYLLDEIRLHGEEAELKEEVMRLSKEYGIMTPYTSYLVLEDDEAYTRHNIGRGGRPAEAGVAADLFVRKDALTVSAPRPVAQTKPGVPRTEARADYHTGPVPVFDGAEADRLASGFGGAGRGRARVFKEDNNGLRRAFNRDSGAKAIQLGEAIRRYKQREQVSADLDAVRHVGKKTFYLINGQWVDSAYRETLKAKTVAFAGDEYFRILEASPELKAFLALGEKVIVVLDDGTALIVD